MNFASLLIRAAKRLWCRVAPTQSTGMEAPRITSCDTFIEEVDSLLKEMQYQSQDNLLQQYTRDDHELL